MPQLRSAAKRDVVDAVMLPGPNLRLNMDKGDIRGMANVQGSVN